jgi:hypothetical protein
MPSPSQAQCSRALCCVCRELCREVCAIVAGARAERLASLGRLAVRAEPTVSTRAEEAA